MSKFLIVGDSQAQGTPGQFAERKLQAAGHTTRRIANAGKGAIDYVNTPALWSAYTSAVSSFRPDGIILIFGSNDFGSRLDDALLRMKNSVTPPVWMSGPPLYPETERQRRGESIRTINQQVFGPRWIDAWPHTPLTLPRDSLQAHLPGEAGRPWGEAIAERVMRDMTSLPQSSTQGGSVKLPFVETAVSTRTLVIGAAGVLGLTVLAAVAASRR